MHDFSIGELESLVGKAYRGCGFSWGLAQEAGVAAGTLARCDLPSANVFAQLLSQIDGTAYDRLVPSDRTAARWRGAHDFLCPVITGCALSDLAGSSLSARATLRIEQVVQPLIVLPFLSRLSFCVDVRIGHDIYRCEPDFISGPADDHQLNNQPDVLEIKKSNELLVRQNGDKTRIASANRAFIDDSSLKTLTAFAHRTCVPASESSRLSGAGAGLLDND